MTSPSKAKGSAFERTVSQFLTKLYGESFVRAAHSGAYIGGTNVHRKNSLSENQTKSFKGDIIPPDSWNHFNAEAKNYAEFPFHLVITGNCKVLDTWLSQLMDVADPQDCSILFIKITRKGQYVVVPADKFTWVTDNFFYYSSASMGNWVMMEFDSFFDNNKELFLSYAGYPPTTKETP